MKIAMQWLIIGLVLIPLCGFDAFRQDPVTAENRIVKQLAYRQKKVTFKDSMVWYDRQPPTRGILFPVGEYPLEAEDQEYYYFKAPNKLEYRVFRDGEIVDSRSISGGLCLNKTTISLVPAGAYMSVDQEMKTITWKLGIEFLQLEGDKWIKNYRN